MYTIEKGNEMEQDPMEKQENIDAMLLLEGRLQERVGEIVDAEIKRSVVNIIGKIIYDTLEKEKASMLMEIAIKVGQMLKGIEAENRKPLWETTEEQLNINKYDVK